MADDLKFTSIRRGSALARSLASTFSWWGRIDPGESRRPSRPMLVPRPMREQPLEQRNHFLPSFRWIVFFGLKLTRGGDELLHGRCWFDTHRLLLFPRKD